MKAKFDASLWSDLTTPKVLIDELTRYYQEFALQQWTQKDISSFLFVNFHLVRGLINQKHREYIASLLLAIYQREVISAEV
jgi:hypothetical protein